MVTHSSRLHCHLTVISRDISQHFEIPCTPVHLKHFLLQRGAPATLHSYPINHSSTANAFHRTFSIIFHIPASEACRSSRVLLVGDLLVVPFRLLAQVTLFFALSDKFVARFDGRALVTHVYRRSCSIFLRNANIFSELSIGVYSLPV